MTRFLLAALAFALVALAPGKAISSCFFNKAICQAICSKDCCDGGGFLASPTETQATLASRFAVADLRSELEQGRHDRAMQSLLRGAIQRADTGTTRSTITTQPAN